MFNYTQILIEKFTEEMKQNYHRMYGNMHSDYCEMITWAGNVALEIIAGTDTLYHNVEHTILVTLVGQEILRGKHIKEYVSCEDWLHTTIALLCHDIGYVKGVCRGDDPHEHIFATGLQDEGKRFIRLEPGSTDASLTPYHVDRGMLFITERFGKHAIIDANKIKRNIELTRFPVPADEDHKDTSGFPGLVRAADLIGQLSDPRYLCKISALFYEFEETGTNVKLGYKTPGDLRRNYPTFFWRHAFPYLKEAIEYLNVTQSGKAYVNTLFSNVFRVEHEKQMHALQSELRLSSSAVQPSTTTTAATTTAISPPSTGDNNENSNNNDKATLIDESTHGDDAHSDNGGDNGDATSGQHTSSSSSGGEPLDNNNSCNNDCKCNCNCNGNCNCNTEVVEVEVEVEAEAGVQI